MALDLLMVSWCLCVMGANLTTGRTLQAGFAFSAALCFMVEAMGKWDQTQGRG